MNSWKTSLCGVLGIVGGTVATFDFHPLVTKIAMCLSTMASSLGLMFARDNGVTSEQAGAKSPGIPANVVKLGLVAMLFTSVASISLTGCKTAFQSAGVVVVTADRAADGWADYVVETKARPPYDTNRLAFQEIQVREATLKYQSAMDAVYFARKAAIASGDTNATPEAVTLASTKASASLVNLILSFLPAEKIETLNTAPK